MMKARQVGSLLREATRSSSRRLSDICFGYSDGSRVDYRVWPLTSCDEDEAEDSGVGGSEANRREVTIRRPATLRWAPRLANSVQLIGSVDRPVEAIKSQSGNSGAYTTLRVKNPLDKKLLTYRIMMVAWGEMAEVCRNHLKPGDFVSVSGLLGSYSKSDDQKGYGLQFKIIVKELNFVDVSLHGSDRRKSEVSGSEARQQNDESATGDEADMELYQNHLWEAFFCNPERWRDTRTNKKHNWYPDFIHKNTREGLWLTPDVPSWVKTQLHLLDSTTADHDKRNDGAQGTGFTECRNALYLWQLFFRSPHEWWDNRMDKKTPRSPDFKHKETGEALWIRHDHPPWVNKQLALLDSRMAEALNESLHDHRSSIM